MLDGWQRCERTESGVAFPPGLDNGGGGLKQSAVRLRRTARRSVPNFHPKGRGFAFRNSWNGDLPVISLGFLWNKPFDSLPGPLGELGIDRVVDENWAPITHADAALCGGMV